MMVRLDIEQDTPFHVTFAGVRGQLAADRHVLPKEVAPGDVFATIAALGNDAGYVEIADGGFRITPKRRVVSTG